MTRHVDKLTEAEQRQWRVQSPESPWAGVLLAHGAGAGMSHTFLEQLSAALVAHGLLVVRFEFDYMQTIAETGRRRPPDKMPALEACMNAHYQAVNERWPELPWFLMGKSMGGRVAATVVRQKACPGVICVGYPFHPPKKPDNLRLEPLIEAIAPVLIVQGTRDALGSEDEVKSYDTGLAEIVWLEDGDHDLKPRKRSGYTQQQHIHSVAETAARFCRAQLARG